MSARLTQVRLFLLLARPAVLIAAGLYALVGAAQAGRPDDPVVLPALLAALGLLVASVAWNDLADVEVDRVNLPGDARRPLAAGTAHRAQMHTVAVVGAAVSVGAAGWIGPGALAVTAAGLLLSAAYSLPPTRLSGRGILAPLVLPFGFVAVPYLDGVLAAAGRLDGPDLALLAGLYLGFVGRIILKDFRDVRGDALLGKRTFLVRHGRVATCLTSGVFWVAGSAAVLAVRDVTVELVAVFAVQAGLAAALLLRLARCPRRRREDDLIVSLVLVGRMQLVAVLAHASLIAQASPAASYRAVLAGLLLFTGALVTYRLTCDRGSSRTITDLDVGVLDTSATESSGTRTFVSG